MTTTWNTELEKSDPTVIKTFVKEDGKTTIICPSCESVKIVSVGHFRERQHVLKVRCSCSYVFHVHLDFRQAFRRPTNFTGIYNLHPPAVGGGKAAIHNLSLNGICFEVRGIHQIESGQRGSIDFNLDNRKKTRLVREFTVRAVREKYIGCEFRQDQAFEKELGFYLRFGP